MEKVCCCIGFKFPQPATEPNRFSSAGTKADSEQKYEDTFVS